MADPQTTNKLLSIPTPGSDSGTWGTPINGNFSGLDLMLGGTGSIALSASNYTFSASDIQNFGVKLTSSGALLADITIYTSCIGFFFVENNTSGAHTVTIQCVTTTNYPTSGSTVGSSFVLPQGTRTFFVSDQTAGIRIATTAQLQALLIALSGSTTLTLRRTENDTTPRKALSIQSGSGSGNDYSLTETGDGSNNVATVTEAIGSTTIGTKTSSAYGFPIPLQLSEISTPSAPPSSTVQFYAKSGDILASQTSGGVERVVGVGLAGATFLTIKNNSGTPNSQADITSSGQVVVTNSSGVALFYSNPGTITCNLGAAGANGLDTGSITSSTWYYLYYISNGSALATIASATSPTSGGPSLPGGYTYQGYMGAMRTDGSAHFYRTIQKGNRSQFTLVAATNTANFLTVTSGSTSSVTTSFSTASFAPATSQSIKLAISSNSASNLYIGANTQLSSSNNTFIAAVNINTQTPVDILFETANTLYWQSANASAAIYAIGWTDSVNAC